jgi:hypothetical protein
MSDENPTLITRDAKERIERTELFKQVALAVLSSRPALVLTGSVEGKILTPQFVEEVSLIAEGILKTSKTFGES